MKVYSALFPLLLSYCIVALTGCEKDERSPEILDGYSLHLLNEAMTGLYEYDFDLALALVDSVDAHRPGLSHAHFMRGRILSELGRLPEADEEYHRALEINSDYRSAWNNLGDNAIRQGALARAIEYFEKEYDRYPGPVSLRGKGRAYEALGRVEEAREAFQQAVDIDSAYAPAYLSLAILHENNGRINEALNYALRALSLDSNHVGHRYRVGSLMVKAGRFEEAIKHLEIVAENRPWYHGGHFHLGQALARLGREDEAKEHMDSAERTRMRTARIENLESLQKMDDPNYHAAIAWELQQAGRHNDAMRAYQIAHHLAPTDIAILNNIANLHFVSGDTVAAIHQYESILRMDPNLPDIWVNLGIVNAVFGRMNEARRAWKNALQVRPDHEAAKSYLFRLDPE